VTLKPGTTLGAYTITDHLGSGGMGEVYRARDTRLKREVAIKVLPSSLATDPDRLARLQREAEVLASLNHSHIAQIHGLEEIDGASALVMEMVEGPTLADRLVQGPLPMDEALDAAKQIAEALEAAHERGVIHRDLKPANIKIRPDGTVKILDFGLAKAVEPVAGASGLSRSPTITTPAMTQAGVILGTAAYMSPEQARGTVVDKRADVWSYGLVLYEMLTGRRLFDEASVPDTLAAVLKSGVELTALPAETPPSVRTLLARCLTRDPRRRLRDIGEARVLLEDALANPQAPSHASAPVAAPASRPRWNQIVPWAIALVAVGATTAVAWRAWRTPLAEAGVARFIVDMGAQTTPLENAGSNIVLTPDGTRMIIVGRSGQVDRSRIYIRQFDQLEAKPLLGTDGARDAFVSPDGQWIGFFAEGKLKKVPINGGAPVTLCDAPDDRGGAWSDDGWIALSPRSGESPLFRVSAEGGKPEPLTKLDEGEITHRWPQLLPGGAVLYTANASTGNYENANIVVQTATNQRKVIRRGGYYARYLPSGYLVFASQGRLFAAAFDIGRFEIVGQAAPVVPDVATSRQTGNTQFTFDRNGTLVYVTRAGDPMASLHWMQPDGTLQSMRATPTNYASLMRFSPDGERLAVAIRESQTDIWIYEWKRDVMVRVTSDQALDADPVWTPDGRRVTFRSARNGVDNLFWQRLDGGQAERLTENKVVQFPQAWHPSGKLLAFRQFGAETGSDLWLLPMDGDDTSGWKPGTPRLLMGSRFDENGAAFSPDGAWIAFESDETGRSEVYVSTFPDLKRRWQVSTEGGVGPRWSRATKELYFISPDQRVMVAAYAQQGDTFSADKPRRVSDAIVSGFDIHPDGRRLAVLQPQQSPDSGRMVVILNFAQELRRLVPAAR
jgi:serine/threonine-protein kinase